MISHKYTATFPLDPAESPISPSSPAMPRSRSSIASTTGFPSPQLLSPAATETATRYDLETLLENAGNFVKMSKFYDIFIENMCIIVNKLMHIKTSK